jgi:hypothetical protein
MKSHNTISNLLKNKTAIYQNLFQPHQWGRVMIEFMLMACLGIGVFGIVMGTISPQWQHWLLVGGNLIILLWGSIALCTPSLFVFSAMRGSSIKLSQMIYLLLGGLATSGIVLLALTPLTWFFTWTTTELDFIRIMNGFFIGIALVFGLFFFGQGLMYVYKENKAKNIQTSSAVDILFFWFFLLLIVVAQMSMKLGPWY